MKIADFFVQITAKGDLKELKAVIEYQKAIQAQAKADIANAKLKTAQIKVQAKEEAKKPKTLKEYLVAQGKIFTQQNKMNMLLAKGVLQAAGLTGAVMGVAAAAVTAAIAVDRMVTKLAQANQLYTNFQRQTGISMGSAIGTAGAMANLDITMSPADVMKNMQNLQNNLIGIQFGQGNIAPYQMAGINPWGANAANMMDVIRKQLKGFAPAYRTFLLQQMGLDPRLGALIDLSDKEYLKYKQEALELYLSAEDRKAIQQLAPEWNKVNLKFAKYWDKLTLHLMKDFSGLASVLGHMAEIGIRLMDIANTIFKPLLDLLTLVLKPIYYLLDDIIVFLLGGKSILGDMLHGQFPTKAEWVAIIAEAIGKPVNNIKEDDDKFIDNYKKTPLLKLFTPKPMGTLMDVVLPAIEHFRDRDINKNVSMKNDINIYVNSPEAGLSIAEALRPPMNSAIAQLSGGIT